MTDTATGTRAGLTDDEVAALHAAAAAVVNHYGPADVDFGRLVVAMPPHEWDDDIVTTVYDILGRYRPQLDAAGVTYADMRVPVGRARAHSRHAARALVVDPDDYRCVFRFTFDRHVNAELKRCGARFESAERRWWMPLGEIEEARDLAVRLGFAVPIEVEAIEPHTVAGLRPPDGKVTVTPDGSLLLSFKYHNEAVARVKALRDRRYTADGWLVGAWQRNEVLPIAREFGWRIAPEVVSAEVTGAPAPPPTDVAVEGKGDYLLVKFTGDGHLARRMKALPGCDWSRHHHAWVVPIEAVTVLRETLAGYRLDRDTTATLQRAEDYGRMIDLSQAHDAPLDPIPGLGVELRPFQRAGVAYALRARRAIVGDDMGLGKTGQALAAVEAAGAYPVVVVTPGFLKPNWLPEVRKWLPHRSVVMLQGRRPRPFGMLQPDIVVVNYDLLDAKPNDPAEPVWTVEETRATGWTRMLIDDLKPQAVVVDEAHYLRGTTTKRAVACAHLGDAVPADGMVLALTGTPVVNRRSEVWPILRFIGRHTEFGNGTKSSLKHVPDLARRLRSRCMVRRLKGDVLADLPPRQWNPIIVEGDPDAMAEYRRAESRLLDYLAERAARIAEETGLDPKTEAFKARLRASAAEHLVAINVLRQLAARARVPAMKDWVTAFLQSGRKLLVFAHHTAVVDDLGRTFDARVIKGGMTNAERMAAVTAFQENDDTRMLVISITAGGAGLTLTAASDVLFAEQGWSPADMDQALDRCYGRLNDAHGATGWVPIIGQTIDVDMAELIADKRGEVAEAVDGVARSDDEVEQARAGVLADLVVRLTDRATTR